MTDKYYPRTEIKKIEVKLWELRLKGTDVIGYNQRFQELELLCGRMFPEESDKIEKYLDHQTEEQDKGKLNNQQHKQQHQTKRQNTDREVGTHQCTTMLKQPEGGMVGPEPTCYECDSGTF
ncbi:hypothetical protein Tco_0569464 [Tanacetum coccineum]